MLVWGPTWKQNRLYHSLFPPFLFFLVTFLFPLLAMWLAVLGKSLGRFSPQLTQPLTTGSHISIPVPWQDTLRCPCRQTGIWVALALRSSGGKGGVGFSLWELPRTWCCRSCLGQTQQMWPLSVQWAMTKPAWRNISCHTQAGNLSWPKVCQWVNIGLMN